jgi:hypothetical protein
MNRIFAYSFLVFSLSAFAAEPLALRCEGVFHIYPNGFGGALPELESSSTRIVEIDLETGTASTNSLFGQKAAPLKATQSDRFYSFVLKHNTRFKGKLIAEEQVTINRYTGEIYSLYVLDPQPTDSMGYAAFSGTCKRATMLF